MNQPCCPGCVTHPKHFNKPVVTTKFPSSGWYWLATVCKPATSQIVWLSNLAVRIGQTSKETSSTNVLGGRNRKSSIAKPTSKEMLSETSPTKFQLPSRLKHHQLRTLAKTPLLTRAHSCTIGDHTLLDPHCGHLSQQIQCQHPFRGLFTGANDAIVALLVAFHPDSTQTKWIYKCKHM